MRAIFERSGADVQWDSAASTAVATGGSDEVKITTGSTTAYHNGEAVALDVPAMAVDRRTLVPVRFVSEALNAKVDWIPETQTVSISTNAWAFESPAPVSTPEPAPMASATVSHTIL